MFQRRQGYNDKRKISAAPVSKDDRAKLEELASRTHYGGNPEHKKNPGDFNLTPPANWKPDKELCDRVGIFKRNDARKLLRKGVRKGLVSVQVRNGWPQNIWSVSPAGEPLEAQLENQETGSYHGYPMSEDDPFREDVIKRWKQV